MAAVCSAEADLSVSVSDSQDPVTLGTNVNYVLIVTNNGPALANNLVLTDALNSNGLFQSIAAPEEWQCTSPKPGMTGSLSCTAGQLDTGKSATFTVTVKPVSAGVLTNTGNITSPTADPNDSNNSDYEDTTVITSPETKEN